MKKILSIFLMVFALVSCSETQDVAPAKGSVTVELSKQAEDLQLVTRTVDSDLQADVLNEAGEVLHHFDESAVHDGLQDLMLEAGTYTLRAYTANYGSEYTNAERGEAKYYAETTFVVQAGKHVRLGLRVPMTNMAVSLQLPAGIADRFTGIRFTLTRADRSLELSDGETAYFDLTPGADLDYSLTMTNADGETNTQSSRLAADSQKAGTRYIVSYTMGRLQIHAKQ